MPLDARDNIDGHYVQSRNQQDIDDRAAEFRIMPETTPQTGDSEQSGGAVGAMPGPGGANRSMDLITPADGPQNPSLADVGGRVAAQENEGSLLRDVIGIPTQAIGAVRDIAQEVIDITAFIDNQVQKVLPIGGWQIDPETGDVDFQFGTSFDQSTGAELPEVPRSDNAVINFGRELLRFAIGFKGVGSAFRAARIAPAATKGGAVAQDVAKGFLADLVVWDEHEERLSDFLRQFETVTGTPILNEVTEFLQADDEDNLIEGKMKQAIEGGLLGLGVRGATELAGLTSEVLKVFKRGRKMRTDPAAAAAEIASDQVKRDIIVLGDPSEPRFRTIRESNPTALIRGQLDEGTAPQAVTSLLRIRRAVAARGADRPAALDEMLNALRDGVEPKPGGKSLKAFIAQNGGVQDIQGEVSALGITNRTMPGLVRQGGRSIDDVARDAWERGFFPELGERPTVDEFLQALKGDVDGVAPRMIDVDQAAEESLESLRMFEEELDRLGIDLSEMSNDQVRQKLDDITREAVSLQDPEDVTGIRTLADLDAEDAAGALRGADEADLPPAVLSRNAPNFSTIDGPEDLDAIIKEMADANSAIAARGRGGVVSNATTKDLAAAVGIDDVLGLEARRFDAAEIVALKDFYASSANLLKKTSDAAIRNPSDGNLFAFQKAMAIHQSLLEKLMGARAEAGRTLQALRIPSDMGDLERLAQLRDISEQMGGRDVLLRQAELVNSLKDGSNEALNGFAMKSIGARTIDAVQEAWVLGLVSGPRTQARNILGNAAFLFQNIFERGFAARLPGSEIEKGEAMAFAFGAAHSLRQAFVNSGKAFWTGQSGYGIGKVEAPFRKAISGKELGLNGGLGYVADGVGEFYRLWGRFLGAGDEIFKTLNYNGELAATSLRQARQAGLEGEAFYNDIIQNMMNPNEALKLTARESAQTATFTKELGGLGKNIQNLTREYWPLKFLLPFIRTPGNLFKEGFKRSPIAMAMPKSFWAEVAKGGAARDLAVAKMTMGSGAMMLFADLQMRGQISGRGPIDPVERSRLRETGWQPYSMLMPDHPLVPESVRGKWVNYRSIEPFGQVLGMAADVTDLTTQWTHAKDSEDPDAEIQADKLAWAAVTALGNSVTSQTFMRSVSEFFTVMSNPWYAERWVQRYAQAITIPRAVPAIDDIRRSFADGDNPKELKEIYGMMDALQDQIPWMRDDMRPLRNLEGDPVTLSGAWGPDWISPVYTTEDDARPYASEIIRNKARVTKPNSVTSFEDPASGQTARVNLRSEQWADVWDYYQQQSAQAPMEAFDGMNVIDYLDAVVEGRHGDSELYNSLPDGDESGIEDKGKFIKDAFNKARRELRRRMMEDPDFADLQSEIGFRARRKATINEGFGR